MCDVEEDDADAEPPAFSDVNFGEATTDDEEEEEGARGDGDGDGDKDDWEASLLALCMSE